MLTLRREDDAEPKETFLDRYTSWAATRTDAPIQYHTTTAVVILSTIMAPVAVLEAAHTKIRPNVWVMILADSTRTRKSTSMDMSLSVLHDVHPDFLLATDGSPEGILTELSYRDGKVSVFHRDEITGFIEAAQGKDYLAGMLGSFTRLYDNGREKRQLRRETVEIKEPRFVMLTGGILNEMQQLITPRHITSGFIPRFLMVTGKTAPEDMRPIGPPEKRGGGYDPREDVIKELLEIINFWTPKAKTTTIKIGGLEKKIDEKPRNFEMMATPQAWERIQTLQNDTVRMGQNSVHPALYDPMYQRLSDTLIKIAILLAGADLRTEITFQDVCTAISYSDVWLQTATDFIKGVEDAPDLRTPYEKKMAKLLTFMNVVGRPVSRSQAMRDLHTSAKVMDDIERTLVDRNQIRVITSISKAGHHGSTQRPRKEYVLLPFLATGGPNDPRS
jgi:hypothetical protein